MNQRQSKSLLNLNTIENGISIMSLEDEVSLLRSLYTLNTSCSSPAQRYLPSRSIVYRRSKVSMWFSMRGGSGDLALDRAAGSRKN